MKQIFTLLFAICLVAAVNAQQLSTSAVAPANNTQPVKANIAGTAAATAAATTPIAITSSDDNQLTLK